MPVRVTLPPEQKDLGGSAELPSIIKYPQAINSIRFRPRFRAFSQLGAVRINSSWSKGIEMSVNNSIGLAGMDSII